MRVFIAIELEQAIKKALSGLQSELLKKTDIKRGDVKWVEPDSTHLTLKFLGEISDQQLVTVCNVTKEIAAQYKSFDIDVGQVGTFGGKAARVLWVGAGLQSKNLMQLQAALEEHLEQVGWPKEGRQFSGHLTICRIKNVQAGIKLSQLAEGYKDYSLGQMEVDSLCVFQSELQSKGPIYTVLGKYELG
jgi:RNA 2',3'-cyclic 3'-phosphodiesterase